ncbi:hypothetical protein QR680_011363 [Steinernema hermaphroditum]|uniref:ShKT domain-containing protein n=1 Tax=Steinernema hermaphroditum TaxID=289476 RepID=A0AA39ITH8_9BILA|nr:hypothetical protein QR680_011363 [Steinernema hermaphroditum]
MKSFLILILLISLLPLLLAQQCPNREGEAGPCINRQCQPGSYCFNNELCCIVSGGVPGNGAPGAPGNGAPGAPGNGAPSGGRQACRDLLYDCSEKAYLCSNTNYRSFMKSYCSRTCNTCNQMGSLPPPVAPSSGCTDRNLNCLTWTKNGFCFNSFFTTEMKRSMCPSSCNLC